MRRAFTVFAFSCLLVSVAQADHIGLYNDPQGSCNAIVPLGLPTPTPVYVVHKFNSGALGTQFKIQDQSGLWVYSLIPAYDVIGVWNSDWAFSFGDCVIGDHVVATLNFLWFGVPFTGCGKTLQVVPARTSPIPGEIVVADCASNVETATGGTFYFEAAAQTCGDIMGCLPLPVQSTSWGAVKALYR